MPFESAHVETVRILRGAGQGVRYRGTDKEIEREIERERDNERGREGGRERERESVREERWRAGTHR
jgi:hypothetical protein